MNIHGFAARRPLTAASNIDAHVPRVGTRSLRAWLNAPVHSEPLPISLMYGLELRLAERPDNGRSA